MFSMRGKMEKDVELNLHNVEKIDITGMLLIYKIIEFSAMNNCFNNPIITIDLKGYAYGELYNYGFWNLIQDYVNDKMANYGMLDFQIKGKFFIAPLPLIRTTGYSQETIKDKFLPKIENYYVEVAKSKNINLPKLSSMILQCFSEILLNFWEHAVDDTKSIITAIGNSDYVEIACADTGKGIISNLSPIFDISMQKSDILAKALEKGVTSKLGTNHMGCGLWILNQITTMAKGRLRLYSEGAYVINEFGTYSKGECAYWKGTIIHIFLPLSSPRTLSDIEGLINDNFNDLKINFQ